MKEINFLLEENEKVIDTQKTVPYKVPQVIAIFLTAIAVVCVDCFFLGIGLTMAILSDFKWLCFFLFLIKLIVDVGVFAGWFFAVKEKSDRAKFTSFTVTDKRFILFTERDGETSFRWFDRKKSKLKIKRGLLRKFFGVSSVSCSVEKYRCKVTFLKEQADQIKQYFN